LGRSAKGGNGEKGLKGVKSAKKTPFGEETPSFVKVKETLPLAKGEDGGAKYD
jgi:hypothetical protein